MDKTTVRQIQWDSKEYESELALRDRILRQSLNLDLFCEDLSSEINDIHIGAFSRGELVGVLVLTLIDEIHMHMRQVAVCEKFQGEGIGTKLVKFSERFVKRKGYKRIQLHARKTAVKFYIKLGYIAVGEEFIEVGIPHLAMEKMV